jgi:type II secretory pathway pseudopilin PulG
VCPHLPIKNWEGDTSLPQHKAGAKKIVIIYRKSSHESGFSLVEVMIAGIILFIVLTSANKALMLGMAGTRQASNRAEIESQILNDIEIIQGIDTELISDVNGCLEGGSAYLKTKIEEHFQSQPSATSPHWQRTLDVSEPTILTITYHFKTPESTASTNTSGAIGMEQRVLEINPSFLSECSG